MPTGSDLINLDNLVLTDTFNTWFNRTNQIVDALNPLQVYVVEVGATGGLKIEDGMSAGNYNGVETISVNPGPGIGTRTLGGESRTIVDFALYDDYGYVLSGTGGTSSPERVATDDEYIINDVSEGGEGIAKKVQARYMLPPEVDVGTLVINGDLIVDGSLTTLGNTDLIYSNNLRIEDKQIELAYQQAIPLTLTGVTASTFNSLGATAYYYTPTAGLTPTFYGHIQSFTAGAAGPTGVLNFGALFQDPYGPEDIGTTGYISYSSTGQNLYAITSYGAVFSSFLSDAALDEGGIILKSATEDKSFLWIYTDNDTGNLYNAWLSNENLGVQGSDSAIISRVFRSHGYSGVNQSQFVFASEAGKNTELYFTQTSNTTSPLVFTGGSWRMSKNYGSGDLVFGVGSTGIDSITESFRIAAGPSGTTYPNITTANFARGLNVDQLDGAHATTGPTSYGIPVADSYGRVDADWLNASSMRRRYNVTTHGFTVGDVLRLNSSGTFVKALATDEQQAEAIGIVSEVNSVNEFTLTYKGKISGLSGASMTDEGSAFTTGSVYFLSADNAGKLIADPDFTSATKLDPGEVRKPMLLAVSATEGIVLNYVGVKLIEPTDEVYLPGLVPVGSICPYAGSLSYLSSEWLVCDGDRYRAIDYPELYNVIGRSYSTAVTFASTGLTGTVYGSSRSLTVGDNVTIGSQTAAAVAVDSSTARVTFDKSISAGTYNFNVSTNSSGQNIFMVPDLRTRVPMGSSTGSSQFTSVGLSGYSIGSYGGNENLTLSTGNLPSHAHTISAVSSLVAAGSGTSVISSIVTGAGTNTSSVGSSTPVDVHQPYLVTNYIIRAKANTTATILTGHDHDLFYPRYDGVVQNNFGPSTGATAGAFRNKIGAATTGDSYTKAVSDARYYLTGDADSRFWNNGGDSVTGTYVVPSGSNFMLYQNSTTKFIEIDGNAKLYVNQPYSAGQDVGIYARNYALGLGSGNNFHAIMQCFGYDTPGGYDSRKQTVFYGDFTVYGPGLSSNSYTGHAKYSMGVDSLINSMWIRGGFTSEDDPSYYTPAPTLKFLNSSDSTTPAYGSVQGLMLPPGQAGVHEASHEGDDWAACKYYVDDLHINEKIGTAWGYANVNNTSNTYNITPGVAGVYMVSIGIQGGSNSLKSVTITGVVGGPISQNAPYDSTHGEASGNIVIMVVPSTASSTIAITSSGGNLIYVSWARLGSGS